jgi:hypothetical protein
VWALQGNGHLQENPVLVASFLIVAGYFLALFWLAASK